MKWILPIDPLSVLSRARGFAMRASLLAVPVALLACALAHADRVILPDNIDLSGKRVEILEIRETDVLVRVAYGDITIPRSRIVKLEVDFEARLEHLKAEGKDTPRALFDLGRVCGRLDMAKEAAEAYRLALAGRDIPDDVLLPLAREFERRDAWAAAHQCYQHYLKLHPDNADIQAKARAAAAKADEQPPAIGLPHAGAGPKIEITEHPPTAVNPGAQQPIRPPEPVEPGQPPNPVQPNPVQPDPVQPDPPEPAGPKVKEGLEGDGGWSTEAWGSTIEVSVGVPQGGANDKMLRVFLGGNEKDKACVMLEDNFDLTKKEKLIFDVHNFAAKDSIQVAVAFITRPAFEFYESVQHSVLATGAKPRTITLDLVNGRFKTAKTRWRFKSTLENKKNIIKFYFLIYTKLTGEWVFFNNIRFEPPDEPKAPPPPIPAMPAPAPAPAPAAPAPAAPVAAD